LLALTPGILAAGGSQAAKNALLNTNVTQIKTVETA
jgi:hypothetical protein